ncbi:MAG: hypothetical protein JWM33_180, partial [Caulobacteraceae bacterium]|nr:hypothetical protein [Caulobacteraceae bacterium]
MIKSIARTTAVLLMASTALVACTKPATTAAGGDTVKVGVLQSLSGTMAIS